MKRETQANTGNRIVRGKSKRAPTSKNEQSDYKTKQLHAAAQHACEQQRVGRWPEHVTVDELPAAFLSVVLLLDVSVARVSSEVVFEHSNENGGKESGE